MQTVYVGGDVAKDKVDVAFWENDAACDLGVFSNDQAGFTQLQAALTQHLGPEQQVHLVLEPTGGYELYWVAWAAAQEWLVSLPNPKKVRDWAKGMGYRAKSDPVDARVLAHYGAVCQPHIHHALSMEVQHLDSLLKRQQDLEKLYRQERNRQHAWAAQPDVAAPVLASVERVLAVLEEELATIAKEIAAVFQNSVSLRQQLEALQTIPGIGPKNGPYILVLLSRWDALTQGAGTTKQLTAYVGLDPRTHTSGSSVHRRASISKMGNPTVRKLLFLGALGGVRAHSPLREFYHRLVERGKAKKLALVAAARKILTWAWVVFSRGEAFDPLKINPNFV
jgi:transposase